MTSADERSTLSEAAIDFSECRSFLHLAAGLPRTGSSLLAAYLMPPAYSKGIRSEPYSAKRGQTGIFGRHNSAL